MVSSQLFCREAMLVSMLNRVVSSVATHRTEETCCKARAPQQMYAATVVQKNAVVQKGRRPVEKVDVALVVSMFALSKKLSVPTP